MKPTPYSPSPARRELLKKWLDALPVSEDFKRQLTPLTPYGVFEHPSGLVVKAGEGMEKQNFLHYDYPITFTKDDYRSAKTAKRAALLHALFYRELVDKKIFPEGTKVIVHASTTNEPAISFVQPKLPKLYSQKTIWAPLVKRKIRKLFEAFPGFEELAHIDLYHPHNYGYNGALFYKTLFLHDPHVFGSPHSKETLAWLEKRYESKL